MKVAALDHLVLTVADVEATVSFYERLGMRRETFESGRVALRFGEQKINLHQKGAEFRPHAAHPMSGSADLCFLVAEPIEDVVRELGEAGIEIEVGPVTRVGATTTLTSIYVRDPDQNLIELSQPQ